MLQFEPLEAKNGYHNSFIFSLPDGSEQEWHMLINLPYDRGLELLGDDYYRHKNWYMVTRAAESLLTQAIITDTLLTDIKPGRGDFASELLVGAAIIIGREDFIYMAAKQLVDIDLMMRTSTTYQLASHWQGFQDAVKYYPGRIRRIDYLQSTVIQTLAACMQKDLPATYRYFIGKYPGKNWQEFWLTRIADVLVDVRFGAR